MEKVKNFLANNWLFLAIIAFILVLRSFVFEVDVVDGISMEPTLHDGDYVITDRQMFKLTGLDRFDVVVLDKQYGMENVEHDFYLVKRVVGLPGETVEVRDGIMYIDGKELEVDGDMAALNAKTADFTSGVIPDNHYFVLGDNRNNSLDSRVEQIGYIDEKAITGHVIFRHRPLEDFGFID